MIPEEEEEFQVKISVVHSREGLHSIRGFLCTEDDEEYDITNPLHTKSTVSWMCWNDMIQQILTSNNDDVYQAIKVTQRQYKLNMNEGIKFMRKYGDDEEVSEFIAQVDNFIQVSILLGTC
jgi:hypothetical protein